MTTATTTKRKKILTVREKDKKKRETPSDSLVPSHRWFMFSAKRLDVSSGVFFVAIFSIVNQRSRGRCWTGWPLKTMMMMMLMVMWRCFRFDLLVWKRRISPRQSSSRFTRGQVKWIDKIEIILHQAGVGGRRTGRCTRLLLHACTSILKPDLSGAFGQS